MAEFRIPWDDVREFKSSGEFHQWLATNQAAESVWIKIHKRSSGLASINPEEGTRMALCWGWIDGIRKGLDEISFLQRYSRRRSKSNWSAINARAARQLLDAGLMAEPGLAAIRAAIADGRWPAAVDASFPSPPRS